VMAALVGRTQSANLADFCALGHLAPDYSSRSAAQKAAVITIPLTVVTTDQRLLVSTSKPAPVSSTKCRIPDARWLKNAQLRPTRTTYPGIEVAAHVKVS